MKKTFTVLMFSTLLASPVAALAATKNLLSVHVLNQQTGRPAPGVKVVLEQKSEGHWKKLASNQTDQGGRISALWPDMPPAAGDYRVIFMTGDYFKTQHLESFFPEVPVEFHISGVDEHYHIPLLLSQYGYSTYRGS